MRLTSDGPTLEHITATAERRRQSRGVVLEQMRRVRDLYNGDIVIPLPELDDAPEPAVPNLIVNGLEQSAQRIASVLPNLSYPAVAPGSRHSEKRARIRRMANLSWWEQNKLGLKMRRRARWFIGYSSAPALVLPDDVRGIPRWEIRDPLTAFPCPSVDPDCITPSDCIFTYTRPWAWIRDQYPVQAAQLRTGYRSPQQVPSSTLFEIIEYVDAEVRVTAVLGRPEGDTFSSDGWGAPTGDAVVELDRMPTRIGMCPAVVPGRITLDRPRGQFDGSTGMYVMQARLMALESIAVERGIFPDMYLVSRQGETATFIDGPHDGRSGEVNIVRGGDIKEVTINPGFATATTLDRLERAQRITSGTPAEFGGEAASNIRTGRRGDQVLGAVVNFPTQEAQEVFAASLQEENIRAVATARNFFGNAPRSFYVSLGKKPGPVDYIPNRDFESDANVVTYPMPGADANGMVVAMGQRVGLGTMSKRTAMEMDPAISDPESEYGRVVGEGLETALLSSLQQQAAAGAIPPADLARITYLTTMENYTLADAVDVVHKEAQARQANAGPPGTPEGPVPPGAPEAQPGLAQPGTGAEQPSVPPPTPSMINLSQALGALRSTGKGGGGAAA